MNDKFLIQFALCTLGIISFALQHASGYFLRKIDRRLGGDKNAGYLIIIFIMQLLSIAVVMEMMNYAFKK